MNAVMYASLHGHKRCVEYLIEMGADLLHRDREGSTALILGRASACMLDTQNMLYIFKTCVLSPVRVLYPVCSTVPCRVHA